MDKAYCPSCDMEIGPANESPPIQCAKCGIFFGKNASNKPIVRPTLHDPRVAMLRFLGSLFAPTLIFWLNGRYGDEFFDWLPSIPGAGSLRILGLIVFGFACAIYGVNWLMKFDSGVGWLIALVALLGIHLFNAYLFIGI